METQIETFSVGSLAYLDTIAAGMVPCKVVQILPDDRYHSNLVKIIITAKRRGYNKGEYSTRCGNTVIPRSKLFTRNGHYVIRTDFVWK